MRFTVVVLLMALVATLPASLASAGWKWSAKGTFVEGCSCNAPCSCELTGDLEAGCQGVGAVELSGGKYMGTDLTGAKIAYAGLPGQWVRIYVDAKNDKQRDAAMEFAKGYYKSWGTVEDSKAAKIDIMGKGGKYTVKVDDGKIFALETEPILGGDGKTPLTHTNTKSKLSPIFKQAKTLTCTFQDGERKFELKSSNSFFNDKLNSQGTLE